MDINFDRKIISNKNRQYLVQEFPVARVSFQTKITLQFDESQTILIWITKRIYKYNAFCTRRRRRQF